MAVVRLLSDCSGRGRGGQGWATGVSWSCQRSRKVELSQAGISGAAVLPEATLALGHLSGRGSGPSSAVLTHLLTHLGTGHQHPQRLAKGCALQKTGLRFS